MPNDPEPPGSGAPDAVPSVAGQNLIIAGEQAKETHLLTYPVVAIGASAGGLEAYIELFAGLPADTGLTFVVIPHLSPEYESHLVEILARHTRMPVQPIANDTVPGPNCVYVLPPAMQPVFDRGRMRLLQRAEQRLARPIDAFLASLAADQKHHAIGIILSGSDSDGSIGLRSIKAEGGIAIVQEPDTARFPDMPRSSILADHVDLVLPPGKIGPELARIGQQFLAPEIQPLERGELPSDDEQHFLRILNLLKGVSGIDFRQYKPTTIRRRLARRMMLRHFHRLSDYLRHLQGKPEELRDLQEDLLINVTRFFRDSEVFDSLKREIFPRLFENRSPEQQVRIWVTGCSTGEETYSIAISLLEFLSGQAIEPPIQIFGTDASETSIERARTGLYAESISADVSLERLRRFFTRVDSGYQVNKRVRDLCIFARQNLCTDPPFSRLDLVSCRNVLIYLTSPVQNSIITTFHYALKPTGFLMLGSSESLRAQSELFQPLDRKHRFYSKVPNARWVPAVAVPYLRHPAEPQAAAPSPSARDGWSEYELQRAADRIVLARYGPPGVVVNESFDVLQVRGDTSPYLKVPPGAPSLNLLRMAREELAPVLRDAIRQCVDNDVPARVDEVHVRLADEVQLLSLEVLPVQGVPARPRCYMVLFVPQPAQAKPEVRPSDEVEMRGEEIDAEIRRLQQDLASSRMYLQSLVEERDARNQELTSAYEEVQSANEELQSTNEELETAKEELQSTNEELQTVNEELRNRNTELLQASNDLQNLFNSVNIPVVMLDSQLTIRHFTPPTERLMHVRPADLGRHIGEIRLNINLQEIEPLLMEVLESLATREVEVQDRQGRWHLLRIRPYRTSDNKIDGLVLVLLDIEQIRRSEQAMREAADFARALLEGAQAALVVTDEKLRIRTANAAFRALCGEDQLELEGRTLPDLVEHLWGMRALRLPLSKLAAGGAEEEPFILHLQTEGPDGRHLRVSARTVPAELSMALLVMIEDLTADRRAQQELQRDREQLTAEVEKTTAELKRVQEELRALNARLFTSQEEERQRLARDLHDDIGQRLAAIQIQAESLAAGREPHLEPKLSQLSAEIEQVSSDLRYISHGLHPSVLDDLGLAAALRQLVEDFGEQQQTLATFTTRGMIPDLPPVVAGNLYRIAQEALRNVAKHAGNTQVRVLLAFEEGQVKLHIRDLGEGFDLEQGPRDGLGLLSMSERARLVGGQLRITSELGSGTAVDLSVPFPETQQGAQA